MGSIHRGWEAAMKKTVTCPHCDSSLVIDVEAGVVVDHTPPVRIHEKIDFNARLKQMEVEKARSADKLAEAMRQEESKERLMDDKFRSLMEKAKDDDGTPYIRDIDLD
jgi:Zn-finger nucleic acid-binding protein